MPATPCSENSLTCQQKSASLHVCKEDIDSAQILKLQNTDKGSDVLLVRFNNGECRKQVYKQRTKLKILQQKIHLNEELLKDDKARKEVKDHKLYSAWIFAGMVWAMNTLEAKPFCLSDTASKAKDNDN